MSFKKIKNCLDPELQFFCQQKLRSRISCNSLYYNSNNINIISEFNLYFYFSITELKVFLGNKCNSHKVLLKRNNVFRTILKKYAKKQVLCLTTFLHTININVKIDKSCFSELYVSCIRNWIVFINNIGYVSDKCLFDIY